MSLQKQTVITLSREEMISRALVFAKEWVGPQREEANAQTFLNQFFTIFGRERRSVDAHFEHRVERAERGDGRIDLYWPGKLIVEMKSTGKDLSTAKGGAARQAFDYVNDLDPEDRPRWIMVSDFAHFVIYDLGPEIHEYLKGLASTRKTKPIVAAQFTLRELPDKLRYFSFIRDEEQLLFQTQPDVNLKAVALLGELHDELKKTGYTGHQLERFLVRILFCVFAEDTDIFDWNSFTKFVQKSKKDGTDIGPRLAKLFQVLNQDGPTRSTALDTEFAAFPYINGGLFSEKLDIADMTAEQRAALLQCCQFDWSKISPGVFGSLFQGVMDKKERREKGAHYTSEVNILRVINPLFLDDLKAEFKKLRDDVGLQPDKEARISSLRKPSRTYTPEKKSPFSDFHDKLASLKFLDPACGCGNFLVVAYRELRALELEVLHAQYGNQLPLGLSVESMARLNVDQFFGIELEEFPALIAETALWLTDHQVNMAFSKAFGRHYVRIPLKKSPTIINDNALRIDWDLILPPAQCSYVLGNPPFIGKKEQSPAQKADAKLIWRNAKGTGILDYVTCWYAKAANYIAETRIICAFVSTNSISQGEQVGVLWDTLRKRHPVKIHFAHTTFAWENEAEGPAHVHVVIIGFANFTPRKRTIYLYDTPQSEPRAIPAENLNPYLVDAPDVIIRNRKKPINGAPEINYGSMMIDKNRKDGADKGLILLPKHRRALLDECPDLEPYILRLYGGDEFINDTERYCLWMVGASPALIRRSPLLKARIEGVQKFREGSKRPQTNALANRPTLFGEIRQPDSNYLLIPKVSSEHRKYIPIGFLSPDNIASGSALVVPGATLYHFGILSSAMHNGWMRYVGGRLESRYQYSNAIIYNNFPWPEEITQQQRAQVEEAAQAVLDARRGFVGTTLADLYDQTSMPPALAKAHEMLNRAVDKCYRDDLFATDHERVEHLFVLYEKHLSPLLKKKKRTMRV